MRNLILYIVGLALLGGGLYGVKCYVCPLVDQFKAAQELTLQKIEALPAPGAGGARD